MPRSNKPPRSGLDPYREKRSLDQTPEPAGSSGFARPGIFVVQKHSARRLHFDIRFEVGGVLKSWAVPRGPSFDPAVKRLSIRTEDHPVEYADFEGKIPKGNYGAGAVIVWDRGQWIPRDDPEEGIKKGKLLFELRGYKLRGLWTLVKTKGETREWLLIKKVDQWSGEEGSARIGPESILSGLTVEQLREGYDPSVEIREMLTDLGAKRRKVDASTLEVMNAHTADKPFSRTGWIFELKYDGYRLISSRDGNETQLFYRSGRDSTRLFPDVTRALSALPCERVILDGEVIVVNREGLPSFHRLQQRVHVQKPRQLARAVVNHPASYVVFDMLAFEDFDLRDLPLTKRKIALEKLLPPKGPIQYSDHIDEKGEAFFEEVKKLNLEGVMAKRAAAPYRSGRSFDWLKMRFEKTEDCVIVGFSPPDEDKVRTGFRALHLAAFYAKKLTYVGRVGSGFNEKELVRIRSLLDQRHRDKPACENAVPKTPQDIWVEPELVCEVKFLDRSEERILRQPVFVRMRDDKTVGEMIEDEPDFDGIEEAEVSEDAGAEARKVPFTNLDKVFWPEEGLTKGDLIDFYKKISKWLLPYLKDRPLVMTRYPDGIAGKNFFQKDAPPFIPGWVRTERMWSEHAQREIDYFVADDEETLLYLINLGSIPLHVWSSRVTTLQQPDWTILDLDPKGAPFSDVVTVAKTIRKLLDEIELVNFVKTSGASGLHILIPLGGQVTYQQGRSLAELIARIVVAKHPDIATVARKVGSRGGRVYVDYLQNRRGQLLVSPLSVRPLPGAPVSTPLKWSEVNNKLDPAKLNIETVPARLARQKADPLLRILDEKPDLMKALARLSEIVDE